MAVFVSRNESSDRLLDPLAKDDGCLRVIPGTHRKMDPDPYASLVWTGHMVGGCSETWWTHLSMLGIVPEVKLGDLMSGEERSRLHRQLSAE